MPSRSARQRYPCVGGLDRPARACEGSAEAPISGPFDPPAPIASSVPWATARWIGLAAAIGVAGGAVTGFLFALDAASAFSMFGAGGYVLGVSVVAATRSVGPGWSLAAAMTGGAVLDSGRAGRVTVAALVVAVCPIVTFATIAGVVACIWLRDLPMDTDRARAWLDPQDVAWGVLASALRAAVLSVLWPSLARTVAGGALWKRVAKAWVGALILNTAVEAAIDLLAVR
jgi:hypothetical protein